MLKLCPVTLKTAQAFIKERHRHHKSPVGHKFSIGVRQGKDLVGVAVVSRPVSRILDAQNIAEVSRLCTDGTPNACSILYAACARAAKAMGYDKIVTYVLESECGSSLTASGWVCEGAKRSNGIGWGKRWDKEEEHPEKKIRWAKMLS